MEKLSRKLSIFQLPEQKPPAFTGGYNPNTRGTITV